MAAIQTSEDIRSLLARLEGREIQRLQVLGINSLKSMTPMPEALAGQVVTSTSLDGRQFTIVTGDHEALFDLQRTGKLVWLRSAAPSLMKPGTTRPTVRLILVDGQGLELTEPAKTKRVTVTISPRA